MMNKLFIANWKMQLLPGEAIALAKEMVQKIGSGVPGTDIVIAPAHDAIYEVGKALKGTKIILGAQDCFWEGKGAYTGEVSPLNLKKLGCQYIIVGHSERREKLHETDEMVAKKLRAVLASSMTPVLCVGESLTQKRAGETEKVLARELDSALFEFDLKDRGLVIAYEPIWAIGTGVPALSEDVESAHRFIRASLERLLGGKSKKMRVIYGGSVDDKNMSEFLAIPDVFGALVGGASLKVEIFSKIVKSSFSRS